MYGRTSGAVTLAIVVSLTVAACGGAGAGPSAVNSVGEAAAPALVAPPAAAVLGVTPGAALSTARIDRAGVVVDGTTVRPSSGYAPRTLGGLGPLGMVTADSRTVVYNASRTLLKTPIDPNRSPESQGITEGMPYAEPSVRAVDLVTRRDTEVVPGASGAVLAHDGRHAFARVVGGVIAWGRPTATEVMVAASPGDVAVRWSDAGGYTVLAWADDTLLAYEDRPGTGREIDDLVAFDGPGRPRVLRSGGELLAVSPGGDAVLVGTPAAGIVELVTVADGATLVQHRIDELVDTAGNTLPSVPLPMLGDWRGDRIVTEVGDRGLAVFIADTRAPRLTLERLLELPDVVTYGHGAIALANDGATVTLGAYREEPVSNARSAFVIECSLATGACAATAPVDMIVGGDAGALKAAPQSRVEG
jgi:hypothetical protein